MKKYIYRKIYNNTCVQQVQYQQQQITATATATAAIMKAKKQKQCCTKTRKQDIKKIFENIFPNGVKQGDQM